ncbi:MAG: 30S ribosomal protein S6 [Chloroflexota bacterium]|nr:30S ribosomal protein S6 [Chloroflexota bacterium]
MDNIEDNTDRHEYEMVYVAQPNIGENGLRDLNERLVREITRHNGTVSVTEMWGKRTLAYQIEKYYEGHYVLQRFVMAPAGAQELDRLFRLNENVIRYLIMRTDE